MNEPNPPPPLVLASASPRRRELLASLGVAFEVAPADIDESIHPGESPEAYVRRMAGEKALAVADSHPGCFLVGSDTAVVVDDECLGKPADQAEARAMLGRLSGRRHRVLSSVALAEPDGRLREALSETAVDFAPLPEAWVDAYLGTEEPYDKAGAYGIQGAAGVWVCRIEGSYTGVVGLPLFETAGLLRAAGFAADAILADKGPATGSQPA